MYSSSDHKNSFSTISSPGFWYADESFKSWAAKMEALHEHTWRKAGIFEAIKASTCKIRKNPSLIQALVEKWCPETKSFVFPWGEATITLEDVMVLLGFSVLGSPVFAPLESSEMRDAVEKLEKARQESMNTSFRVSKKKWSLIFRNRDDQTEHEAFLALWLSHFVFPDTCLRSVSRNVLSVAVRLARGERIALAIPVLANLYRDLGQIRDKSTRNVNLKSLFKLLQVWTWERFKNVRPEAKEIPKGQPRISRWDGLQKKYENVRLSLDDFDWRPYTKRLENWNPLRFYVEEAMWITIDDNLEDEFVAFARCVRSSQLVGIGFVEDYYPNRVAMQFGLSQDLPGLVTHHSDFTEKEAWDDFNKSLAGVKLYMPSRLSTASVTTRYRDWWLKSVSQFLGFEESNETCNASNTVDDDDASLNVMSLGQVLQNLGGGFPANLRRCRTRRRTKSLRSVIKKSKIGDYGGIASTKLSLRHLFRKEVDKTSERLRNKRCKRAREEDESSMDYKDDEDDDNITIAQRIRSREISGVNACESLGKRSRLEENKNDSRGFQEIATGDEETIAPQEIEQRSDENDEEEIRRETEKISPVVPAVEINFSDSPHVVSNGVINDDDYGSLKKRKLPIDKLILEQEARIVEAEKKLANFRNWLTRRSQLRTGVSA